MTSKESGDVVTEELHEEVSWESGMSEEGTQAAEAAIAHLRESIDEGKHWYPALLEAIGLWAAPDELYQGQPLCYLIAGEAFDWMVLARRLCDSADGLIPKEELAQLLERTHPPIEVSNDDFKNMVGGSKYRALLNYWYGVDVEEALVKALIDSISKERIAAGLASKRDVSDMAFHRAYGGTRAALLEEFAKGRGQAVGKELSETEAKEFTYWLFKYRLENHDKARVASDTKRGLQYLKRLSQKKPPVRIPPINGC